MRMQPKPRGVDARKIKKKKKKQGLVRFPVADTEPRDSDEEEDSDFEADSEEESVDFSTTDAEEGIELLFDRSSKSRVEGYGRISKLLTYSVAIEFCEKNEETLQTCILSALKKGTSMEVEYATHVLSLCCATRGEEADHLWNGVKDRLRTVCKDHKDVSVRRSSIFAYAVCLLLSGTMREAKEGLATLAPLLKTDKENRDVILRSWALLATIVDPNDISGKIIRPALKLFSPYLTSLKAPERMRAGELLALLFSIDRDHREDEYDLYDYVTSIGIDNMIDNMNDIIRSNPKHLKKEKKKAQRKLFREIVDSIQDEVEPESRIKIGDTHIEFSGWTKRIQFGAIKTVIGEGLHMHLVGNELMHEIFAYDPPTIGIKAKTSKETKAEHRQKARENKQERTRRRGLKMSRSGRS